MTAADRRKEDADRRLARVNSLVTSSVREFNKALFSTIDIVEDQLLAFQHRISLAALAGIIQKTPVDTGRARSNWQLTVGTPAFATVDDASRSVEKIVSDADQILSILLTEVGGIVWIANNLDYILFLEDGSSRQAPQGMVRVTLIELAMITA